MTGATKAPKSAEEAPSKADEFDHVEGDGLRIKKSINKDSLWIKGDGCLITFGTNTGRLRVSGDGCQIHIECNLGTVEYRGDGGQIILGAESQQCDRVVYKGDGGLIDFAGKRIYVCKSQTKETKTTKGSRHLKSKGGMRTNIVGSNNVKIHFNLRVHDKSS